MKRVFVALTACLAAAFVVDLAAQPPENNQDRPRSERREGDRGDRGDRGNRPDGERGSRFGGGFGGGGFRMPPNPVVAAIDADGNGELSEEEIKNASKALAALDKNKDGKITAEEMRPQFGPGGPGGFDPSQFVNRILENDANKDGKLSKDELPEGRMRDGFDRWDANKDGFADKAEIEQAMRNFGRGPGGPGGRPGRDGSDRPNRDNDRPATDRPVTSDDL
jgi:Ca2+-binding EF-hand superfamily protein